MISMTRGETLENKIYHARDYWDRWADPEDFAGECIKVGQVVHEQVVSRGLLSDDVLLQLGTEGFLNFRMTGELDEGSLNCN